MRLFITGEGRGDIRRIAERLAGTSPAAALAFIDELEAGLALIIRRLEGTAAKPPCDPDEVRYAAQGRYLLFYCASAADLVLLHVSEEAAEIDPLLAGDGWGRRPPHFGATGGKFQSQRMAARRSRMATALPAIATSTLGSR
jgi:plasmid stabilization system protein ParE